MLIMMMMMMTAVKIIIVIGITMAFPPCLSTILPSLSLLRSACQWIPHTYLHHTIIFEYYHQRLPKTAWQHQVFEPVVESKESVCVMKKRPLPLLSSSAIRRRSFPHLDLDLCPSAGVLGGSMRGVGRRYSL